MNETPQGSTIAEASEFQRWRKRLSRARLAMRLGAVLSFAGAASCIAFMLTEADGLLGGGWLMVVTGAALVHFGSRAQRQAMRRLYEIGDYRGASAQ